MQPSIRLYFILWEITVMKKSTFFLFALTLALSLTACGKGTPAPSSDEPPTADSSSTSYTLSSSVEVKGRQGVCTEGDSFWVSGTAYLSRYDKEWKIYAENRIPFEGFEDEANHIGDIDVYNNEVYAGLEIFKNGKGENLQIAVYDGSTLELIRRFPVQADSGQQECSGIAVDPDSKTIFLTSWVEDASSSYLYMYDLESGAYKGKLLMDPAPILLQGVAYYDGSLYVTCDDGNADENAPDHMYRIDVDKSMENGKVVLEKTLDDVTEQGEIEGLSFDKSKKQLLVLYNRGAKIVNGVPKGFYEGYKEEVHEVFIYDIQ